MDAGSIAGIVIGAVAAVILLIVLLRSSIKVVQEKEVMIIERFGSFHRQLTAGINFLVPFLDRPRTFTYRYVVEQAGHVVLVEKTGLNVVSTQNEVLDFPKQPVITRDNATAYLDAILNYKIINPKQMIYSCNNLPDLLSKLLQAALRNVAGSLELDQIIEDTSSMNVLTSQLDQETSKWGVKIIFVKIQNIDMPPDLREVLSAKKDADLRNQEIIIGAKARKQTMVIESEGQRDAFIRRAEGEAAEMLARARGEAQAILNRAKAEERSIKEIARAIAKYGEDPARYLLSLKYIEALRTIVSSPNTDIQLLPDRSALVQVLQQMGLNTVLPHTPAALTPAPAAVRAK